MKLKKIILVLIILLVIIICMILSILSYIKKNLKEQIPEEILNPIVRRNTIQKVDARNEYYVVQGCIEKFYLYYSNIFKNPLDDYKFDPPPEELNKDPEQTKKEAIEKVYPMLDKDYIEYKGITLENFTTKLPEIGEVTIAINKMYIIEKEEGISIYFAYGTKTDSLTEQTIPLTVMLKKDSKNRTFKILLDDYVETYHKDIEIGQTVEIKEEEISNDKYNTYSYEHIYDEDYVNDLFAHYKNNLKNNKEYTYNLLDEKYREQCFDNVEEYISYMNTNYPSITYVNLVSYTKKAKEDYTEYLFKDRKENYYIFRETAPFEYTVILGNYVIPTEDFTETYNNSSETEKVILNIKKFFMGIDDKNYGYSYNLLSESFRNNKYPSKQTFIEYAKQNFFEENEIEYVSYKKQNGVFVYEIILKDASGKSQEQRKFNMIVKLNSGTDFEMSFGEN